jgi:hypothetical protein
MKLKFLVAAGLFWAAGTAWGQVAAPPLTPGTFALENPAAIKWGSPSRVGILGGNLNIDNNPGGPDVKATGFTAGVRLVGGMFAVAAEASQFKSEDVTIIWPGTTIPVTAHLKSDTQNIQAAVQLGNHIALGAGQRTENARNEGTSPVPLPPLSRTLVGDEEKKVTATAGVSLRLGEWFFIGAAGGQEKRDHTDLYSDVSDSATRDVTSAGVGVRTGSTVLFHAEGYVIDKAKFPAATPPVLRSPDERQTTGGTVEFIVGRVLLGYNAEHTNFPNVNDDKDKADAQTVVVGWVPRTGLSIAVHVREEKTFDKVATPGTPQETETIGFQFLAITYLW